MNIRSLLLGSAAALFAASGARAADAIIAEPEPVEYVRVCDVYGAGFFYIPGTETCIQISGYVWYQIGATTDDGVGLEAGTAMDIGVGDGWLKWSRARVNFDARSETEWGTLRGFIRIQGNGFDVFGSSDFPLMVDQAFIQLGGLVMGYTESAFTSTPFGGVSNFPGSHSDTGLTYAYQQRQLIQYNFTGGNGLHGTLSLEHDPEAPGVADDNYIPDVVGVVGINQGWGGAWIKAAYDDEDLGGADDGEFAVNAGLHVNLPNMQGSSVRLIGMYSSGLNAYSFGPGGTDAEWSVIASYAHQFTPVLGASVGAQYWSDIAGIGDGWETELSVVWTPVENFEVRSEVAHRNLDGFEDTTSGYVRFTRYF